MPRKILPPYRGIKDVALLECGYKNGHIIRRYIAYQKTYLDEIDPKDLCLGCNAYCIEDGETYYVTSNGWQKKQTGQV